MRPSIRRTIRLALAATVLGAPAVALGTGGVAQATTSVKPTVSAPVAFGVSAPVRDLPKSDATDLAIPEGVDESEGSLTHPTGNGSATGVDPALQTGPAGSGIPPTSQNFEGIDVGESSSDMIFVGAPPDTNGDVGPDHYVQTVNTVFAIWDKTGNRLVDPTPLDELWLSAANGGEFNCTTQSRGDPVVQYDPLADRWLISQFNFPVADPVLGAVVTGPFDECVAISTSADPTGDYYLYDFRYSLTMFNDYPHFGVWPDGYYMSVNQFDTSNGEAFTSAGACAFEREKMIAGDSGARQVCFDESAFDPKDADGNYVYGGQLPTDLDGTGVGADFQSPPPAGEPNTFFQFRDSTTAGADQLLAFQFHVDWSAPENSTFGNGRPGGDGQPITIPVADFDSLLCNGGESSSDRDCLPQKDSESGLDAISDRLMYRASYRNFGDHESVVLNHTVAVGDADKHAGIRWYEIRDPSGSPIVHQQSTYAPDDESRWMGSIAMDQTGAVALGYALTSSDRNPAIAYTARRADDALNQMTLGEAILYQGAGAQDDTGNRWGDYSSMSVAPDGCTFWYTQEYYPSTDTFNWNTRIGAFALPTCGDPQISMTSSAPSTPVRGDLTYDIAVNTGEESVLDAQVTDVLPGNVTLLSVSTTTGSCSGRATIVCDLGDLPAGDLEKVTLVVHTRTPAPRRTSPRSRWPTTTATSTTTRRGCRRPSTTRAPRPAPSSRVTPTVIRPARPNRTSRRSPSVSPTRPTATRCWSSRSRRRT